MRVLMGFLALTALGLAPAAEAATVTYSQFYPGNNNADPGQNPQTFSPTDWDGTTQSVTLPQFDPTLGTLTDATLQLYGGILSSGTLVNTGSSDVTVNNYVAQMDISMLLPDGSKLTASPAQFSITTPITLAGGASYAFGADAPVSASNTNSVSATALDPYTGPGSVTFPLLAATSVSTPTPNDALKIRQSTGARAQATIIYTYDAAAVTDVPEPASAALLGVGLLGLGLLRQRA